MVRDRADNLDVFNLINEQVMILSPKGKILNANEALCKTFGFSLDDIIGKKYRDVFNNAEIPEEEQAFKAMLENNEGGRINYEIHTSMGACSVILHSVYDKKGALSYVLHESELIDDCEKKRNDVISKQWDHAYFGMASHGVFFASDKGDFLRVNNAFQNLSEYSEEDLVKMNIFDLFSENRVSSYKELLEGIAKRGSFWGERGFLTKSNRKRYWKYEIIKISKCLLIGFILDDTENLLNREKMAKNEKRLEEAQKLSKTGSWELDLLTNKLFWSDVIYDIFELSRGEFSATYNDFLNVIHPEDRAFVNKAYISSLESMEPYSIEHRLLMPDGRVKLVMEKCETIYSKHGVPLKSIGTIQDITERKKLEEKNLLLRRVVEQSPDAIAIFDVNGFVEYVNPMFEKMIEVDIKKVYNSNIWDLKFLMDDQGKVQRIRENVAMKRNWCGELKNKLKNGEVRWERVAVSPVKNERGEIDHFVMISEDITKEKKTLEELKSAQIKAVESDKLKSAFLANISHEIRTPMNGILGFTNLLKEPNLSGEEKKQFIDTIQKSGKRMLSTMSDIIDISKIESGLENIHWKEVDVDELVMEIYFSFREEALRKRIQLKINKKGGKKIIFVSDQYKLKSIIANLVKNALKFTKSGEVSIDYSYGNNELQISVTDTGIGIPPYKKGEIFTSFYRRSDFGEYVFDGCGVGLAIVKAYTEMLKGAIDYESEENKGSVFRVKIPSHLKEASPLATNYPDDENDNGAL